MSAEPHPPRPEGPPTSVDAEPAGLVDWVGTAHRVRRSAVVLGSLAVAGWVGGALLGRGLSAGGLGAWLGLALLGMGVVEFVVVGGAAARGMLRAGERGERLAGDDVGLLPSRRHRRE